MPEPRKRAIYYHTAWATYGRNFQVANVPAYVTDLAYAFMDIKLDSGLARIANADTYSDLEKRFINPAEAVGGVVDKWSYTDEPEPQFFGNFRQLMLLKQQRPQVHLDISIGGWTFSNNFSTAVSTAEQRASFADSIVDFLRKYPFFGGVSLDWEFLTNDGSQIGDAKAGDPIGGNGPSLPRARVGDADRFVIFLRLLRKKLRCAGLGGTLLSFCTIADPAKLRFDIAQVAELLDEVHAMSYDFHDGAWEDGAIAAHHTAPRGPAGALSAERIARHMIDRGVPSRKIFIGVAFYSRGFKGVTELGQASTGGSPDMSWEAGIVDYKALPLPGAVEKIDPVTKGAYSVDVARRVLNTYDNPASVEEKCRIVHELDLGGVLVWENSADSTDPNRSLSRVLRNKLTHGTPDHPASLPDARRAVTHAEDGDVSDCDEEEEEAADGGTRQAGDGGTGQSGEGSTGQAGEGSTGQAGEGSTGQASEGSTGQVGEDGTGQADEDGTGQAGEGGAGEGGANEGSKAVGARVALGVVFGALGLVVLIVVVLAMMQIMQKRSMKSTRRPRSGSSRRTKGYLAA
jgi:chitinase